MIIVKNNKTKYLIFVSGLLLIATVYLAVKLPFTLTAHKTTGVVYKNYIHGINKSDFGSTMSASIRFETADSIYTFLGPEGQPMQEGQSIPVMYNAANPHEAYLNTFAGYWLNDLIWCLLPSIFWLAFSLSFIRTKAD